MKKIYGTFGVEMRAYGQKLVKFCTQTHTHRRVNLSSIDVYIFFSSVKGPKMFYILKMYKALLLQPYQFG